MPPQADKPDPDNSRSLSPTTNLVRQMSKPEPGKLSSLSGGPPTTGLVYHSRTSPLAQIPTSTENSRTIRVDLPQDYKISERDKPKLDEAVRQVNLARDYVNAQINIMVKEKIAAGEYSGEMSAEYQKLCTAECTMEYWAAGCPRFSRMTTTAGATGRHRFRFNRSDLTIDMLLACMLNSSKPELIEDLRPLVTRDFEAGCFQPAKEPINHSYIGAATWVYVEREDFEFQPTINYYSDLSVNVRYEDKDGVPTVVVLVSAIWDHNLIYLDIMGQKMQQVVDAANRIVQEIPDLLLKAPGDRQEVDKAVAEADGVAHSEGSSSGHPMEESAPSPTKKPIKTLHQAAKCTANTQAGQAGRPSSKLKEMVPTDPENIDMQDISDRERLGPKPEIHEKEKRPKKKLSSAKRSRSKEATKQKSGRNPTNTGTKKSRTVRVELPQDYKISERDKPKLDKAVRQVNLARDYVNAQINSMVKEKIAAGEFSSETSAEYQKLCTAECTMKYWAAGCPCYSEPTTTGGACGSQTLVLKLSDFTVDTLLTCVLNISKPELMEDLRPLVTHDFDAGCFQPGNELIKYSYTGAATWVTVSEEASTRVDPEFLPRINYYSDLSLNVRHKNKDGIPTVVVRGTATWDQRLIYLDQMGQKMQQLVDAANGNAQEIPDQLLKAPGDRQEVGEAADGMAHPEGSSSGYLIDELTPSPTKKPMKILQQATKHGEHSNRSDREGY